MVITAMPSWWLACWHDAGPPVIYPRTPGHAALAMGLLHQPQWIWLPHQVSAGCRGLIKSCHDIP